MKIKKGNTDINEWELMIIDKDAIFLGVHFYSGLKSKEKLIIAKHLQIAAEEITTYRDTKKSKGKSK